MDYNKSDYQVKLSEGPDYTFLTLGMAPGQAVQVEAGAMAAMSPHLTMKARFRGGLKRLLTGESLFITEYTCPGQPGELDLAPGAPGDIAHVYLENDTLFLQNSAFLAAGMNVKCETKWQGLVKGFFSGDGLFLIRCSGVGDVFFNTFGALIPIDVNGGYVVDTSYVVAFTEGLDYQITRVGGYKSLFFSGEGLVCRFSGQGRVWVQTRQVPAFVGWVSQFRPVKSGKGGVVGTALEVLGK